VKFLVDQGIQVFIISWKNPGPGMGHLSFSDYIQKGAMDALRVTGDITASEKVNALGYCVGGTLLGITGSVLAAQDNDIINTNTFIASMIDFGNIGPMGAVIDKALIRKLKRGEILKHGVLRGEDMERAFNLLRPNDLVWNYAVNNYLKGEEPKPFDVLYWTNDNTNLPANMYIYYLKHMIMANKLSRKNFLRICDTSIDIGRIKVPTFVVGFKEDYISPASTAFRTTELVSGPVEFIYGESGHVMGVINPPSKKKYGHFVNGILGKGFSEWKKTAEFRPESWWITWIDKLIDHSGEKIIAAKNLGNKKYPVIEPAPGSYVFEGAENQEKHSSSGTHVKSGLKARHSVLSEQNT
jgi:polyhydroxyalkanoate synthase